MIDVAPYSMMYVCYTVTCFDQMLVYTELCRCISRSFNDRSRTLSAVPDLSILTLEEVRRFMADGLCGLPPLCARELGVGVGVAEQLNSAHELFAHRHETVADAHIFPLDDSSGSMNEESTPPDPYSHIDISSSGGGDNDQDQVNNPPPMMQWVGDVTDNEIAAVVRHLVEQMVPGDCLSFQAIQRCLPHRSDTGHTTHTHLRSSPEAHSKYCTVVCCEAARTLFYEAQVVSM